MCWKISRPFSVELVLICWFFTFQVVRSVSIGARSPGDFGISGVFEHADGGAGSAGSGPSELGPAV